MEDMSEENMEIQSEGITVGLCGVCQTTTPADMRRPKHARDTAPSMSESYEVYASPRSSSISTENLNEQQAFRPSSSGDCGSDVKHCSRGSSCVPTFAPEKLTGEEFDEMMCIYAEAGDWMLDLLKRRR
jgi:hypothetical protein